MSHRHRQLGHQHASAAGFLRAASPSPPRPMHPPTHAPTHLPIPTGTRTPAPTYPPPPAYSRWSGVTSEHEDGRPPRAVALSLVSLNLVGAIPRDFATKCTHLQLLNLSSNALSDLPEELAALPSLRICNLSNNAFDGVVGHHHHHHRHHHPHHHQQSASSPPFTTTLTHPNPTVAHHLRSFSLLRPPGSMGDRPFQHRSSRCSFV